MPNEAEKPTRGLKAIGGFVATLRPDEALELSNIEDRILVGVSRAPGSGVNCRIRIIAHKRINIKRLDADEVAHIAELMKDLAP